MPLFFFDLRHGDILLPDDMGTPLPDIETAEEQAIQAVTGIARDEFPGGETRDVSIEVRDETKKGLLVVSLSLKIDRLSS